MKDEMKGQIVNTKKVPNVGDVIEIWAVRKNQDHGRSEQYRAELSVEEIVYYADNGVSIYGRLADGTRYSHEIYVPSGDRCF